MKKINLSYAHPAGLAAALTAGIIYIICFIFITLWPKPALSFFANWFHAIDFMKIAVLSRFNFISFITGLISIMLASYFVGFIFVLIYDKCVLHCKKKNWI